MWTSYVLALAALLALLVLWRHNDAWFALLWWALGGRVDHALSSRKRELLAPLAGVVVELGAGMGTSLKYYGAGVTALLLVEPNLAMHAALRAAAAATPHGPRVRIVDCGGESLGAVDTSSADAVVVLLTLCSVRDPARVVAEAHRVLKPGGRLGFVEHVRSESACVALLQRAADATALYSLLAGGCHLHRDTVATIAAAVAPGAWASLDARYAPAVAGFPLPLAWGVAVKL